MQDFEQPPQYLPFRSFVDPSFFQVLSDRKLNDYKLDTTERQIYATYGIPVSTSSASSGIITLSGDGFDLEYVVCFRKVFA